MQCSILTCNKPHQLTTFPCPFYRGKYNQLGPHRVRFASNEAASYSNMWNTQDSSNRFNFALVIDEANKLRDSVMALLRGHGWLVHGISRAEQALSVLAHIPYGLIVLDSELPGLCATDFTRILRNSKEWRTVRLVVISSSKSINLESQIADCGAFLARRSRWEDDLSGFLVGHGADYRIASACGKI
jgi:CheY-like chemotaxis protein